MQFDSARERRKVESAVRCAAARGGDSRLGITPVWSNGRTRAFEAQGRGSTPRTGTGEVSPPGEGCGLTRRRARFDSGTSYQHEDREMHRDVGDVAGPDKSVQQGSTPWRCTVRGETAGKSPA